MTLRFGDEKSLMGNRRRPRDLAARHADARHARSTRASRSRTSSTGSRRASASTAARRRPPCSIETTRENLPAVLRLVAEILREPAFPTRSSTSCSQENLAGIEQQKSEPRRGRARPLFQRHMNPYPKGDVRYVQTLDEELAEASRRRRSTDAKSFYRYFYGASTGELAVVGRLRRRRRRGSRSAELFGDWKSPAPFTRVAARRTRTSPRSRRARDARQGERVLRRRAEPRRAGRRSGLPGARARQLHAGRRVPELAARDAHPQKDGLSYGVGSQLTAVAARQVRSASRPTRSTRRRTRRSSRRRSRRRSPAR